MLWHGLLRSKKTFLIVNQMLNIIYYEDINGAMNIWKKMECTLDNQELPDYLKRNEKTIIRMASSAMC